MQFVKMHGAGNDYVYVDGFANDIADGSQLAVRIADRHTGVGGDGLIIVAPPTDGYDAHVRMIMFNADGSEAEMCGNGIRCVAKFAHDRELVPGIRVARPMRIQTLGGVRTIDYTLDDQGKLATATVDMGRPIVDLPKVPVDESKLDEQTRDASYVSMGNPHAVFFVGDDVPIIQPTLGSELETHPAYPNRMNVHFVHVNSESDVSVYHWERGSGATQACGTGACAVAVAGVLAGKTSRQVTTHLPGGDLHIEVRPDDDPDLPGHVLMTGPATEVFTGDWPD